MNPSQKVFKATAPIKGSFPLDHDGECKEFMLNYMKCLKANNQSNFVCQKQSREYLHCRMERGLMEKEDFKRLGLQDKTSDIESTNT